MTAWCEDDLSKFLVAAHGNQQANSVNFSAAYATLSRINEALKRAGQNLTNPKPVMTGILLLRCFYAYRTATGLALAGQVVEAFTVMRSALEYAGYCLVIHADPALEIVFINRHMSEEEMKAQKEAFKISRVRAAIAIADPKLASIFDNLYQTTIDFGGHPNPHAAFGAMVLDDEGDTAGLTALALTGDATALAHALKCAGQAGLTALHILQHVFTAKFELLGLRTEIEALRQVGL